MVVVFNWMEVEVMQGGKGTNLPPGCYLFVCFRYHSTVDK